MWECVGSHCRTVVRCGGPAWSCGRRAPGAAKQTQAITSLARAPKRDRCGDVGTSLGGLGVVGPGCVRNIARLRRLLARIKHAGNLRPQDIVAPWWALIVARRTLGLLDALETIFVS